MKLKIVRGGGIAGIATTTLLQTDALPGEEAKELESKVRSSSLLAAPGTPPPPSHPDEQLYEITVDDGEAEHTRRFSDESMPADVRSLIEWVDSRPERSFEPGA